MAEVAGLVLSAIGLVALVNTVSDGFQQVVTAKHMGRDFENYDCKLALARLAFERWQKCITFTDNDPDMEPTPSITASREDTELVARLLGNISSAFEDARAKAKRYAVEEEILVDAVTTTSTPVVLAERTRARSKAYQKANGILNKFRWTLHDGEALKKMVVSIDDNVGRLVQLFPAITPQQQQLREEDVSIIAPPDTGPQSIQLLDLMKTATVKCDPDLAKAADKTRHYYHQNLASDEANVHYGDLNETGAEVRGSGSSNSYTKNVAKDKATVLYGNRIVKGPSNFFDRRG